LATNHLHVFANAGTGSARRHVVSALSILKLHESDTHRAQYADIARAIDIYGAKGFVAEDRHELFARMVFNILVSNDDDHLRNHAFVRDEQASGWRLSPLYDVVPKPQMASERFLVLGIGKQGRLANLDNALSAAPAFGILQAEANTIINKLATVVREWRGYFEQSGVPTAECDKVAAAFRKPREIGLKAM
jgi:serine/threonine-protein kinase HipA